MYLPCPGALEREDADTILQYTFEYTCDLAYQELIWIMHFSHLPVGQFAGLLKEETRPSTLGALQVSWENYTVIEQAAVDNDCIREELRLLIWPKASWVLEVFICLLETNFLLVDLPMLAELRQKARSPQSTELPECGFNECRAKCPPKGKRMGPERILYTLAVSELAEAM